MIRRCGVIIIRVLLSGLLVHAADILDTSSLLAADQAGEVCRGFVVLHSGFAVLSGFPATPESGEAHAARSHQHPTGPAPMAQTTHSPEHLQGYRHGQEIIPPEGALCVPLANQDATEWTAVSHDSALVVTAASMTGALTHNSRDNEALEVMVTRNGAPVKPADMRLLVRMPHHDRRTPGGHGLANDPDVQGLQGRPAGAAHYTVRPIDLTMAGPWLFEVRVQQGTEVHTAYFATSVGEE
jgi:hypothetical protein